MILENKTVTAVLITGANGQLGSDLRLVATAAGLSVTGLGSAELDITDPDAVTIALTRFAAAAAAAGIHRAVVINAAAYTAVDAAETAESQAALVNVTGAHNLAKTAAELELGFIHVSTDYVFPGDARQPYEVNDPTGPRTVYGATKLAGELAVRAAHPGAHVVRTSWVYGEVGSNFVKTMAQLEASRDTVSVVDDQWGSPTFSVDLAEGLLELAATDFPGGVLHASGGGQVTWCGFARAIFAELGADPGRVLPTTTAAFPRPAPRPAYSVLSGAAWASAGLSPLRDWRVALATALSQHRAAFLPR